MLFLALALFLSRPPQLSPADQAARVALRRAVGRLESGAISRQQFERLAPRSRVPMWQWLQQRIHYPQSGALDLAFVLAYYGVDYRHNLQRLMLPDRLWQKDKSPMPENLSDDLMILHEKHHDTASIAALLDLVLDGGPSEGQEDIIARLWGREPAMLLRLAAGSKTRLGNLEDMVLMEGDDPKPRKQLFAELRRFSHDPDRRVAESARGLLSMARRDFARQRG